MVSLPMRYVCTLGICSSIVLPTQNNRIIPSRRVMIANTFLALPPLLGASLFCPGVVTPVVVISPFSPLAGGLLCVICVLFCSCTEVYIQIPRKVTIFFLYTQVKMQKVYFLCYFFAYL